MAAHSKGELLARSGPVPLEKRGLCTKKREKCLDAHLKSEIVKFSDLILTLFTSSNLRAYDGSQAAEGALPFFLEPVPTVAPQPAVAMVNAS
jgi:hypothetical protein